MLWRCKVHYTGLWPLWWGQLWALCPTIVLGWDPGCP